MHALAVDIDGTLTRSDGSLDPRVIEPLRTWPAPVVVATGKSLPYPVGLCEFIGMPVRIIAENGGAVYLADDDVLEFTGDRDRAQRVVEQYTDAGHSLGWESVDFVNRWRETELAVNIDQPLEPLREIATSEGMRVFDTGYAYHVTAPDVDKGTGLRTVATRLDVKPSSFAVIGDSENDAAMFEAAGVSYAVANADDTATAAADHVTEASYADGLLEALDAIGE
ncbi:phosphoglycolate phosphatase [Halocatena pleomorpha]|uniref:Phosphoglycolate phosphatase n=1 Tax=Halocatena pleomorpha TaxID=1785090 RepID=A0A3P3RBD3_9EURY|nr:phosphoglycolate phosphatase [Halocatena pleomorpha]RRJ30279.1 phosphoglycolate phosphatase [Halocatena pleomorpha]